MKATDEYRQKLVAELIEQSARIDILVINSRQAETEQELEALRVQQQETTKKLQALEDPGSNAWENIGEGG
jgi:short-subunit dehydrogenase